MSFEPFGVQKPVSIEFFSPLQTAKFSGGGWRLHYLQMEPKELQVAIHIYSTPQMQFATSLHSCGYLHFGSMPKGCVVVACTTLEQKSLLKGFEWEAREVIVTPALEGFGFFMPRKSQNIAIAIEKELFAKLFFEFFHIPYSKTTRLFLADGKKKLFFQTLNKLLYTLMKHHSKGGNLKYEQIQTEIFKTYFSFVELADSQKHTTQKALHIHSIREQIEQNLNANITIGEICKELGYSQRGTQRVFMEYMRLSAKKYQQYLRLNAIYRELYLGDTKTVKEIARKYNFFHMGYFSQEFKKMFGISPKAVQKLPTQPVPKQTLSPYELLEKNLRLFYG